MMRDCLHVPLVVINLLSVGRLVDHGFGCNFEDNAVTLRTPSSAGRDVFFRRCLDNHLAFVDIEFLLPPVPPLSGDGNPPP